MVVKMHTMPLFFGKINGDALCILVRTMTTIDEIAGALEQRFQDLVSWFNAQPDADFERGPAGKWTAGQQLDHLIRSTKPLNTALRLPRVALRASFGKVQHPSTTFDEVIAKYKAALAEGGEASGQFLPQTPTSADKTKLMASLAKEGERLSAVVRKWREEDVDTYVLPHPLLGKLTVREMLFFTVYHMDHHLAALKSQY